MRDTNHPDDFLTLTAEEQAKLMRWISEAIQPAKTERPYSSYWLKHVFEHDTGLYVTNGQFKGAMRASGYEHIGGNLNWTYRIKATSGRQKDFRVSRKDAVV